MRASSGSRRRRLTTGRRRRHEYATASIATSSDTGHCAGVTRDRPVGSGWPVDSVVAWKTRAIRSVSTDALQKARFPQHLGRRRRRPQAPQALSPYSRSGRQDRNLEDPLRYATARRELTEHRRYAPTSVHVRRNQRSRSPKSVFTFSEIPTTSATYAVSSGGQFSVSPGGQFRMSLDNERRRVIDKRRHPPSGFENPPCRRRVCAHVHDQFLSFPGKRVYMGVARQTCRLSPRRRSWPPGVQPPANGR